MKRPDDCCTLSLSKTDTCTRGKEVATSQEYTHTHIHTHTTCYFTHSFVHVLEEQEQSLPQVPEVARSQGLKELQTFYQKDQ